ncbi:MAG: PAS domain-containing protein [Marivibrio sp.]|uniref:sensor histidine kinase n=1 Tax=Marivibrio sp. TaxID=2039719 RepID=UPI0032ED1CCE
MARHEPELVTFFARAPSDRGAAFAERDPDFQAVLEAVSEDDAARARALLLECAAGRKPAVDLTLSRRAGGEPGWRLKAKHAPELGGCTVALARDRGAPAQSVAQAIIMSAPFEINLRDPERRYVFINPVFERFFDMPAREALGRRSDEVFGTEAGARYDADVEKTMRHGVVKHLERGPHGGAEEFSVFTVRYPCVDATGGLLGVASISIDVTDLDREALRWREMLEATPDPVLVCDAAGEMLAGNSAAMELLAADVDRGAKRLRAAQDAWRAVSWRDEAGTAVRLRERLRAVASDGGDAAASLIVQALLPAAGEAAASARAPWFQVIVRPIVGSRSDGSGALVLLQRCEELLRLREATRQSERWYRLLAENVVDMILLVSADRRIRYASPSFKRALGLSPSDLLDTAVLRLLDPSVREAFERRLQRLIAGETPERAEYPVLDADGERRLVECNATPIVKGDFGDEAAVAMCWRDITSRRQAEGERYLLQRTLEGMTQAVCLFDGRSGAPVQYNQAFIDLLGEPHGGCQDFWRRRLWDPTGSESSALLEALALGKAFVGVVMVSGSGPQARRPVRVIVDWIDDPETGTKRHIACQCVDYSAEYARLASLEAAYERQRCAHTRREAMIRALGHDLRQPVFALDLITGAAAPILEREAPEMALAQRRAVESLRKMLGDLADVSRLSGHDVKPAPRFFVVRELLERALQEFLPVANEAGVAIRIADQAKAGSLYSDPDLVFRIVRNLLANAIDHSGGRFVTLDARPHRSGWRIEVCDDGRGVPPDLGAQIFEAYVRRPGRTADGLGLGLSIVKGLAELLGGEVRLEDAQGGGARFIVDLPNLGETPTHEKADRRAD